MASNKKSDSMAKATDQATGKQRPTTTVGAKPGETRKLTTYTRPPVAKVLLTDQVVRYLRAICRLAGNSEVGGLGYVKWNEDSKEFIVDEVFVIPQEASPMHVSIASEGIMYGIERAMNAGRLEDLRFSWHSHNTMEVFWSHVDEGAINSYLKGGAPWLLSLVTNNFEEYLARLDVDNVPEFGRAMYDKLPVLPLEDNALAQEEFTQHVKINDDFWKGWGTTGLKNGGPTGKGSGRSPKPYSGSSTLFSQRQRGVVGEVHGEFVEYEKTPRTGSWSDDDFDLADKLGIFISELDDLVKAGLDPKAMTSSGAHDALVAIGKRNSVSGPQSMKLEPPSGHPDWIDEDIEILDGNGDWVDEEERAELLAEMSQAGLIVGGGEHYSE